MTLDWSKRNEMRVANIAPKTADRCCATMDDVRRYVDGAVQATVEPYLPLDPPQSYRELQRGDLVYDALNGNGPFVLIQPWSTDLHGKGAKVSFEERAAGSKTVIRRDIQLDDVWIVRAKDDSYFLAPRQTFTRDQPMKSTDWISLVEYISYTAWLTSVVALCLVALYATFVQ